MNIGIVNSIIKINSDDKINRKDKNKDYLDSLKTQMGEKYKSKLEIEQQKKIERIELEKMFDYNPFGRAGAGAPLKDPLGNTLSSRKAVESTLWKDQGNPYESSTYRSSNLTPQNFSNTYNSNNIPTYSQPFIPQYILPYQNPQSYNQYLPYVNPPSMYPPNVAQENPYIPRLNNNIPQNNFNRFFPNQTADSDYYSVKNPTINNTFDQPQQQIISPQNQGESLISQISKPIEPKKIPQQEIPVKLNNNQPPAKSISQEENEKVKRMQYQNVLLLQIEENKRRKEEEKQRQYEANKLEDQKIKEYHDKLNEASKKEQEKRLRFVAKAQEEDEKQAVNKHTVNSPKKIKEKDSPDNSIINQPNKYQEGINFDNSSLPPLQMNTDVREFQNKIGISFDNINRLVNDTLNDQIRILRGEVHKNHKELNDLIFNIQSESKDAYQIKFEAERELTRIKEQLEKRKINDFVYEKKINELLERNNPYRDLYVPIQQYRNTLINPSGFNEDVQDKTLNNAYLHNYNNNYKDLASSSTMIYNKDELINEKYEFNEKISKLANVGKSLMGDTQFVPINEPKRKKHSESNQNLLSETYYSFKNKEESGNHTANFFNNTGINELQIGTQYSNKKAKNPCNYGDVMTTYDLNNQIDELAKITYKNDPKAKIEALNKKIQFDLVNIEKDNHVIEYHDPKKFSKNVDFSKLDNILNSIIDEENKIKENKILPNKENTEFTKNNNKIEKKENELDNVDKTKHYETLRQEEIQKDSDNQKKMEEEKINTLADKKEENKTKQDEIKKANSNNEDSNKGKENKSKVKSNVSDKDEKKISDNNQNEVINKDNKSKGTTDSENKSKDQIKSDKLNQSNKGDSISSKEDKKLDNTKQEIKTNKESLKDPNNTNSNKSKEIGKDIENEEKKSDKLEKPLDTKEEIKTNKENTNDQKNITNKKPTETGKEKENKDKKLDKSVEDKSSKEKKITENKKK